VLKRFILAFVAFVGLIVPATFALALLAAPPARPEPVQPLSCNRTLADATGGVAAMQARIKSLGASAGPEICTATRLYFLEVVKARGHCTV
jgi:hypothetical protein